VGGAAGRAREEDDIHRVTDPEPLAVPRRLSDNFDPGDLSLWETVQGGEINGACGAVTGEALCFDGEPSRCVRRTSTSGLSLDWVRVPDRRLPTFPARGWAGPPCRCFENQPCCLGSAFVVAALTRGEVVWAGGRAQPWGATTCRVGAPNPVRIQAGGDDGDGQYRGWARALQYAHAGGRSTCGCRTRAQDVGRTMEGKEYYITHCTEVPQQTTGRGAGGGCGRHCCWLQPWRGVAELVEVAQRVAERREARE
jgi:hypothetical protein